MYKIYFFFYMSMRNDDLTSLLVFADETFHSVTSELRELPNVELSTLPLILKVLAYVSIAFLSFPYLFFIAVHALWLRVIYVLN